GEPLAQPLAFAVSAPLTGDLMFAWRIERGAADLDLTVTLVVSDHDARARNARSCQLVSVGGVALLHYHRSHQRRCEGVQEPRFMDEPVMSRSIRDRRDASHRAIARAQRQ